MAYTPDPAYNVTGTVNHNGSPVQGATVVVYDLTAGALAGVATTDVNGEYTVAVQQGNEALVSAAYKDGGGNPHSAPSKYVQEGA